MSAFSKGKSSIRGNSLLITKKVGMNIFDHQKSDKWSPKYVCYEMITEKGDIWSPKFFIAKWSPKKVCFDHKINQHVNQLR
jgi:hypothetical protein